MFVQEAIAKSPPVDSSAGNDRDELVTDAMRKSPTNESAGKLGKNGRVNRVNELVVFKEENFADCKALMALRVKSPVDCSDEKSSV